MRRHIASFTPFFFALMTMLLLSGCVGKSVLPPFKPPSEAIVEPDARPQPPPGRLSPERPQPEQAPPEQTRPGQDQFGTPPSTEEDGENPVKPSEPLPPLQPKLGPAASLYNQGYFYLKEGRLDKAEMSLERALRIEPRNPYYWHMMAEIRLRQGKKQEAIQCCLKANSLASGSSQLIRRNNALINRAEASDTTDAGLP